jgi:hypothetical protein
LISGWPPLRLALGRAFKFWQGSEIRQPANPKAIDRQLLWRLRIRAAGRTM